LKLLRGSARAARSFALLSLVRKAVEDFEERSFGSRNTIFASMNFGVLYGECGVTGVTGAARAVSSGGTELFFFRASGLFASELTFGFGAESGGLAFPGTLGFLTERSTVGFRSSAGSSADGGTADGLTSWAVFHFTHFFGATNGADGLFAVNFTFGAFGGFAVHLALGASAHWMAFGRAYGIVAQPFALGVASGCRSKGHDGNSKNKILHISQ